MKICNKPEIRISNHEFKIFNHEDRIYRNIKYIPAFPESLYFDLPSTYLLHARLTSEIKIRRRIFPHEILQSGMIAIDNNNFQI